MTIDTDGRFVKTPLLSSPSAEIRQVGINPTLILSSDFPLAIGRDGALYYPELGRDERLQVVRLVSSGARTVLAKLPAATESGPLRWLNGMAAGPDGSIYYTENQALRKINQQGTLSTIDSNISVPNCVRIPGYDGRLGVHLRGLDVASDGTVYVAATGCGALLRITSRVRSLPCCARPAPGRQRAWPSPAITSMFLNICTPHRTTGGNGCRVSEKCRPTGKLPSSRLSNDGS